MQYLVKFVEQSPDTVITLVNGEKFIVWESVDEVVERILKFRCSLVQGVLPRGIRFQACPGPRFLRQASPDGAGKVTASG